MLWLHKSSPEHFLMVHSFTSIKRRKLQLFTWQCESWSWGRFSHDLITCLSRESFWACAIRRIFVCARAVVLTIEDNWGCTGTSLNHTETVKLKFLVQFTPIVRHTTGTAWEFRYYITVNEFIKSLVWNSTKGFILCSYTPYSFLLIFPFQEVFQRTGKTGKRCMSTYLKHLLGKCLKSSEQQPLFKSPR